MIRSLVSPVMRGLRSVVERLTGFQELRDRLDRQQATLETIQQMLLLQREAQQELLRVLTTHEGQPATPPDDAALRHMLERLAAQQTQLRSSIAASVKASETTILEHLVDEVDRLDGYLVFHANELRAAIERVEASAESRERPRDVEPPLSHAA